MVTYVPKCQECAPDEFPAELRHVRQSKRHTGVRFGHAGKVYVGDLEVSNHCFEAKLGEDGWAVCHCDHEGNTGGEKHHPTLCPCGQAPCATVLRGHVRYEPPEVVER